MMTGQLEGLHLPSRPGHVKANLSLALHAVVLQAWPGGQAGTCQSMRETQEKEELMQDGSRN